MGLGWMFEEGSEDKEPPSIYRANLKDHKAEQPELFRLFF
jgi:hypothetical protein